MKQALFIISSIVTIFFMACKDDFTDNLSPVSSLKIFDLDIINAKKVHDQYALINLSKILFIDEAGNKSFDFDNEAFISENTISFRFTDVVEGENNAIYVLASELMGDNTFSIYVFKIDTKGGLLWEFPKVFAITNRFENTLSDFYRTKNQYYTILDNGYVLGKIINNQLLLAVNYQNASNEYWRHRIISIDYNGKFLAQNDFKSIYQLRNWTYILDQLPNNNLVLVQGSNFSCIINQYDPVSLDNLSSYQINGISSNRLNFITLTNMLTLNSSEVLFTGHADRRNNEIKAGNFDVFYLRYNVDSNSISDSIFSGEINNDELIFSSFLDGQQLVKSIGTKRQEQISTHNTESSLFQTDLNSQSGEIVSSSIIENRGYEGLFFEKTNKDELTIIGSKFDISGRENKQAFFTTLKSNDYE